MTDDRNQTVYRIQSTNRGKKYFLEDNSHWVDQPEEVSMDYYLDPKLYAHPVKFLEFDTREAAVEWINKGANAKAVKLLAQGIYEIVAIPAGSLISTSPLLVKKSKKVESRPEALMMPIAELRIGRNLQSALEIEFEQKWNDYRKGL